jgi:AhpD family alkylhydroperoxidase
MIAASVFIVIHRRYMGRDNSSTASTESKPLFKRDLVPDGETTMTQRIEYQKQSPELFKMFVKFSNELKTSAIESSIRHLVEIRASQINGCTYCLDMHIKEATIDGERPLRLHHLAGWRESTLFAPRERAALAWTEILTRIPEQGVPDDIYERVRTQLSEKELSDLSFIVMAINAWNRINVGFKSVPGAHDKAFGLDKAGLS